MQFLLRRMKQREKEQNGTNNLGYNRCCSNQCNSISMKEVLDKLNRLQLEQEKLKRQFADYVRSNPTRQQFDQLKLQLNQLKTKQQNVALVKQEEKGHQVEKKQYPYSNIKSSLQENQSQKIEGLEKVVKAGFLNIQSLLHQLIQKQNKTADLTSVNINKQETFVNKQKVQYKNIFFPIDSKSQRISAIQSNKVADDKLSTNPFLAKPSRGYGQKSKVESQTFSLFFHKQKYQDFEITYEEIPKLFQKSDYKNVKIENKYGKVEIQRINHEMIDFQNLESSISLKPNFCQVLDNQWENLKIKVTTYNFMDFLSLAQEQKISVLETVKIQSKQNKLSYHFDEKTGDLQLRSNYDFQ